MTMESAPAGIGAPVKIRTASPGPTAPSKARPAADSPINVNVVGAEVAGQDASIGRFESDLPLVERWSAGSDHARQRLFDRHHGLHWRLSFGSGAACHSPDLPPRFSISRTASMLMPRSIALAMS